MPEISADVITLLEYLAPGLLAASVYFGMTAHQKPSQFERLIQALIYTAIAQAFVVAERAAALQAGEWLSLGLWTRRSDLGASLASALAIGIATATAANHDVVHTVLQRTRMTKRTGHPCEWFGIFSDYPRHITLHLKDESLVHGWPSIWPAKPENGHFFISGALRDFAGVRYDLSHLEGLVVNATDVVYVEIHATRRRTR